VETEEHNSESIWIAHKRKTAKSRAQTEGWPESGPEKKILGRVIKMWSQCIGCGTLSYRQHKVNLDSFGIKSRPAE
jgi:hypothetical protein